MNGRILITGSEGLIGKALRAALEELGNEVVGLDLLAFGAEQGDVRNEKLVRFAVAGCNGVVHLAAVSRVVWAERDPDECWHTNVGGLRNVVEAAELQALPPWLLFASSREVYGQPEELPATEDIPLRPVNIYGRSKAEGEHIVHEARSRGMRTAVVRLSNVYGTTHDHVNRVVPAFARAAVLGSPLRVDGAAHTFDFTHIDDTTQGILGLIDLLDSERAAPPPVHLLTGRPTTLGELATLAVDLAGGRSRIREAPPRSYDVSYFFGSPARATELLGWTPRVGLAEGLSRLIADYEFQLRARRGRESARTEDKGGCAIRSSETILATRAIPHSGDGGLMMKELGMRSPSSSCAQVYARVDVADLVIPSYVDIVLIARHYYPAFGGLQNFTARLADAFHHLGHRPLVVSLDEPSNARTVLYARADQVVPVVHIVSEDRSLFWRRLPNVLQAGNRTTVVLAVGLEHKKDVSAQLHALAEIAASGRISVLRIATTSDFACRVDARLVEACKYLHAIVVLNSAMQAEVERALPRGSRCIVQRLPVIGCALRDSSESNSLRRRWRREQNISLTTFVALWAGRPVRRKRLQKLIRIWSKACIEGVLVLAGVDPESEGREEQDVVGWVRGQPGMDIRLLPPVPPDAMTTLYSAADCFLFTSEREGMSNAVVEALSLGLPVLASDIPGVRDIQTFHCAAALKLFSDIHENEFVLALQKQAARHASAGQHRRERDSDAWRIFDAKAVALRYIDLFERLQPVSLD